MISNMTTSIVIIIVTCLVSITSFNRPQQIEELSLWPYYVKHKRQYYRLITGGLVHADFMHLGFNMLSLYFFGSFIEEIFAQVFPAKWYYILFYVLALVFSHIPTYLKHKDDYNYSSIGASGAVSAVVFASILFAPWARIMVIVIPMPAILYGVIYLAYTVYMSRRDMGSGINHDAHLWGAVFGIVFTLLFDPQAGRDFLEQLAHPHGF